MQTLDVILGIFLLYGLVKGFVKGLVNEVAALVALLLGLWGVFSLADHFVPLVTARVDIAPEYIKIGVYILLFVGIAYGVSLIAQAVTKVLKIVALGWLNRLAGGLFGVLKWSLILSALLIVLEQINGVVTVVSPGVIQQSVLYPMISALGDLLFDWVGEQSVIPNQLI